MAQGIATKIKKRKKSVLKRAAQSIQRAAINRSIAERGAPVSLEPATSTA